MKSSNLAQRLDFEDAEDCAPEAEETPAQDAPRSPRAPRPRRSLESRSIVIRDQGFTPFRVR